MRTSHTLAYMLASFALGAGVVMLNDRQHATVPQADTPAVIVHCSPTDWIDTSADETEPTDETPAERPVSLPTWSQS